MPFASLFGGNKLNIAVLCDMAHGDKGKVQRLKESEILNAEQVFTISDFTGNPEGDVEDLMEPNLASELGDDYGKWRDYWARVFSIFTPADFKHLLEGLRKAGLPA